jgi:hypothetical protein
MSQDRFEYEVMRELLSSDPEYKQWSENIETANMREQKKAKTKEEMKDESSCERYGRR